VARDELDRPSWQDALAAISNEHQGDDVTVEVMASDFGDQHEVEQLPFAYVEYDPHDDEASIGVGGIDGRYPVVLRHSILHPRTIAVGSPHDEEASTLEFVDPDDDVTLVTFRRRPELPA
jgi:hypothetical protein